MSAITLPARCDRAAAEMLLPEMIASTGAGPIAVDGTAVRQVGQSVLQLLVSLRQGDDAVTINPSFALRHAASQVGLAALLFDEVAA